MSKIQLTSKIVRLMMQEAEMAFPNECCGLLIGQKIHNGDFIASNITPSPNIAKGNLSNSFELDPQIRFNVMRKLANGPEKIIGHYHSHPNQSGKPSTRDLKMAFEPEFIWLIIPVDNGLAQRPQAHIVDQEKKKFCEIKLNEYN
jgi:proteasome lid subunit RPN8/RPN11